MIALLTVLINAGLNIILRILNQSAIGFTGVFLSPFLTGYIYTYKFKEKINKESKIRAIICILIFVILTNIFSLLSGGYLEKIGILLVVVIFVVVLAVVSLVVYASFDFGSNMMFKYLEKIREKKRKKSKS